MERISTGRVMAAVDNFRSLCKESKILDDKTESEELNAIKMLVFKKINEEEKIILDYAEENNIEGRKLDWVLPVDDVINNLLSGDTEKNLEGARGILDVIEDVEKHWSKQ